MITVLSVIGEIGGLMGIFVVIGGWMVNMFSDKLFFYSIFSKLYNVETPTTKLGKTAPDVGSKQQSVEKLRNFRIVRFFKKF